MNNDGRRKDQLYQLRLLGIEDDVGPCRKQWSVSGKMSAGRDDLQMASHHNDGLVW